MTQLFSLTRVFNLQILRLGLSRRHVQRPVMCCLSRLITEMLSRCMMLSGENIRHILAILVGVIVIVAIVVVEWCWLDFFYCVIRFVLKSIRKGIKTSMEQVECSQTN